jgi:hypothetical protein
MTPRSSPVGGCTRKPAYLTIAPRFFSTRGSGRGSCTPAFRVRRRGRTPYAVRYSGMIPTPCPSFHLPNASPKVPAPRRLTVGLHVAPLPTHTSRAGVNPSPARSPPLTNFDPCINQTLPELIATPEQLLAETSEAEPRSPGVGTPPHVGYTVRPRKIDA